VEKVETSRLKGAGIMMGLEF